MIKKHLIIIIIFCWIVPFSYTQIDLFKDNSVDSAFLYSLLEKRVIIIGEIHNMNESIEFQTQTIKFLNDHGYRILLECNLPSAFMLSQYVEASSLSLLAVPKFKDNFIEYLYKLLDNFKKINFQGEFEYFDIRFGPNLYEWGWYILHNKYAFNDILTVEQLDSIEVYFYKDDIVSTDEYETILVNSYFNPKSLRDTSGIVFEFFQAFDDAVKLNNKFRKIFGKRYLAYRELKIIEILEKKYCPQDDTSKYVIVTGRSHAWLNGVEDIKSTFSEHLVQKLGRENVGIIISTYPRRKYLSNKVKKYLGISNDDWSGFSISGKNSYIVKPNPDVDYLLILNE